MPPGYGIGAQREGRVRVVGALGWVALAVGAVGMLVGMPWLGSRPRLTAGILIVLGFLGIGLSVQS